MPKSAPGDGIDRAVVDHVATLAALHLTDAEAVAFTGELAAILRYVEDLGAVDTTGVPPTAHVQASEGALRPDVVEPGLSSEDALSQAPRSAHGGFAVPGFVE